MKSTKYECILIFFWVCILFSINSLYTQTLIFTKISILKDSYKLNFFVFGNFIRFYLPFIILPILILFFLFLPKKKLDIFTSLFIIYFCWQMSAFFLSTRKLDSYTTFNDLRTIGSNVFYSEYDEALFNNLQLTFCALSILIILTIAKNLDLKKFDKKIFIITLSFVGLIAIYFTYHLINESIQNNTKFIYFTETLAPDETTFYQANPRITGVSRMLLIFYFLFFFLLLKSHKKIIWFTILIFLGLIIYKMQTRGAFLGIIILHMLFFLFYSLEIKKKIIIVIVSIFIPILVFETYYFSKNINYSKLTDGKFETVDTKLEKYESNRLLNNETSGRTVIWRNALFIIIEKKIIIGYGPQADRFLFPQFKKKYQNKENLYYDSNGNIYLYDDNASNSLVYSYLCGGVPGIFLLSIIYLLLIIAIFKNIFVKKVFNYKKNLWLNFSTILMTYLGVRGIFENSFSIFSIDFIFLVLTYSICKNFSESRR
jgi:hypothetical protein